MKNIKEISWIVGLMILVQTLGCSSLNAASTDVSTVSSVPVFTVGAGQRVLVLGDSISHSGAYISYLEAYLRTRFPDRSFQLFNIGLGSETVAGTSEPDHPWPRPDVHERLDRALAKVQPNVVIACYGMNDGNYYPPEPVRFSKFQAGVLRLNKKCEAMGAKVYWLTPGAFDAVPLKKKHRVAPAGLAEYSYKKPFVDYDKTLRRFADWQLTLRVKKYVVADVHAAMNNVLVELRKEAPGYHFAGDGIHPNASGHLVMAGATLKAWRMPAHVATHVGVHMAEVKRDISGRMKCRVKMGLPWPIDPACDRKVVKVMNLTPSLNRCELVLSGLHKVKHEITIDGIAIGVFTHTQIRNGIDLTAYPQLPLNKQALEVLRLIKKRRGIVSPAWREHVGHKRPGNYPAKGVNEAMEIWKAIEQRIHTLVQPVVLNITVQPVK